MVLVKNFAGNDQSLIHPVGPITDGLKPMPFRNSRGLRRVQILDCHVCVPSGIKLGMRNESNVLAATFQAMFRRLLPSNVIEEAGTSSGLFALCPPAATAVELIQSLAQPVLAASGTLADYVKQVTGIEIGDSALHQRRVRPRLGRAAVDQLAGLGRQPGQTDGGFVCPALGAGDILQATQGGHPFDAPPAKSHSLDGDARVRGDDPGRRGVGGLPHGSREGGGSGRLENQLSQDTPSGPRLVALLGGVGRPVNSGRRGLGGAENLGTTGGHGHAEATAEIMPESLAPTNEQSAPLMQKHLQRAGD